MLLPMPTDVIVHFVIRLMKGYRDPQSRLFLQQKYPQLLSVYKLGLQSSQSPLRCQLQAAILACKSDSQILQRVQWLNQLQLRFYRDVFFDVQQWKHIPQLIQKYLIIPAQTRQHNKLFRSRVLAIKLGYEAAQQSYLWGKGSRKLASCMSQLYHNQRLKTVFNYFITQHRLDQATLAALVQGMISKGQDRDFQRQLKAETASQDATIVQLAKDLHKAIKTYTVQEQLGQNLSAQDDTNGVIQKIIVDSNKEQSHD